MHMAEWIALIMPAIAVGTAGYVGVAKLTRLVDAVERLATSMEHLAGRVEDHEDRLTTLEAARRPRRTAGQ